MSSVLARRQVHNSNIFNFQGHIAQIRKEKLSWVHAAAAEHANQQLGLETISADLLGLPLHRLGIFCLLKATQNQTKSKSSNLLLLLFLDWWYPDDNSAGSSGTKSQWGTASGSHVQSQDDLPSEGKDHSLLTTVWACRSLSLKPTPLSSCPYQALPLPLTALTQLNDKPRLSQVVTRMCVFCCPTPQREAVPTFANGCP